MQKEKQKTIGRRASPFGHDCLHGCLKTSFPHHDAILTALRADQSL